MPDTPMAHLVLTVPPAIAAAWEYLPLELQVAWTVNLVQWLEERLWRLKQLEHPPMSVDDLEAFAEELERKFGLAAGEEPPHA